MTTPDDQDDLMTSICSITIECSPPIFQVWQQVSHQPAGRPGLVGAEYKQ